MRLLTSCLLLLMAATQCLSAEPELHLYTADGKPVPGWELKDFDVHWHKSKLLTKEQQAKGHPLVLHYASKDGWTYDTENLTPRKFRKNYRKLNGIASAGRKTVVWVHAEGCGPCKRMEPFLPEVKKLADLEVVMWDWESPTEFGVTSVPLTVVLDADGKELWRVSGYVPLEEIRKHL